MKRITIHFDDDVAKLLDTAIQQNGLEKYPEYQAYSIYINELISEIKNLSGCFKIF